jgi:hypothetical protein
MAPAPQPLSVRLIRHTKKGKPNDCWPWQGMINKSLGYGVMRGPTVAGKRTMLYAHRVAYEVYKGAPPKGRQVAHLCHNRTCVNPAHLEAVPQRENLRQTVEANRHATLVMHGEDNPAAKLTWEQVKVIRSRKLAHLGRNLTTSQYATLFGVSINTIECIWAKRTWQRRKGKKVQHYR